MRRLGGWGVGRDCKYYFSIIPHCLSMIDTIDAPVSCANTETPLVARMCDRMTTTKTTLKTIDKMLTEIEALGLQKDGVWGDVAAEGNVNQAGTGNVFEDLRRGMEAYDVRNRSRIFSRPGMP